MRKFTGGRLLDRIAYALREPCKATDIVDQLITVCDTFPYNPESKTAPETAARWAKTTKFNYQTRKYEETPEPKIVVRDNEPFSVTITDLHVRSEGGRAYKVVDGDMRRFDLREDQVMEVMKTAGILPGGAVPGTFVWGVLGSQIRLVLVGGELHKSMVEGASDKKAFELAQAAGLTPSEGSLQPGHVYRKKDKSLHLFLGRVKRPTVDKIQYAFVEMPQREPLDDDEAWPDPECRNDVTDEWKAAYKRDHEVKRDWSQMTWRQRCDFDWRESHNMWSSCGGEERFHCSAIVFMASPKFEADVGEVEADFFEEIKQNKKLQHHYQLSVGYTDLSEEWKLGKGNRRPYSSPNVDWRLPREEQDRRHRAWEKEQHDDIERTHTEYRDALQWQD